ncbi:MAG: Major facilitator family transporter [Candidatus Saccharicenans subterraneus]|uniref:Major facilitator family transporter n=1 Tax=Candidatus Saccharicenans subterraneus TaxID=2508984 RepID=A0A3E2BLV2_9BACT|nr:MAG: Major facilitator family transporter [Candidatus Saccharicenans subterraneum]
MAASGRLTEYLFGWFRKTPAPARRALLASCFGWMLDSFDVMLYALVLAHLMSDLSMSKPTAGLLGSLTLLASAFGGMIFGVVADRLGRTVALRASILIYSVFTFMCGLSQNVFQLGLFRVFLGLGMGGEWASGAALVSEYFPSEHRGKALGFMQSFWAVGYALAAVVTAVILPKLGWRAVFFVGILPALLVFWIRSKVEEPELWKKTRGASSGASATEAKINNETSGSEYPGQDGLPISTNLEPARKPGLVSGRLLKITLAVTLMNALTMFAWWGFNLWIPGYLSLGRSQGGVGLSTGHMSSLVIFMQLGMWLGYLTFGYISDSLGRKKSYVFYLLSASLLVFLYSVARTPLLLFFLGPVVAFFGTGYFSGFGALTAELYPTRIRATLQGITYNSGRIVSAIAPLAIGSMAQQRGFQVAFWLVSGAFVLAALSWSLIPETRGRELE